MGSVYLMVFCSDLGKINIPKAIISHILFLSMAEPEQWYEHSLLNRE